MTKISVCTYTAILAYFTQQMVRLKAEIRLLAKQLKLARMFTETYTHASLAISDKTEENGNRVYLY